MDFEVPELDIFEPLLEDFSVFREACKILGESISEFGVFADVSSLSAAGTLVAWGDDKETAFYPLANVCLSFYPDPDAGIVRWRWEPIVQRRMDQTFFEMSPGKVCVGQKGVGTLPSNEITCHASELAILLAHIGKACLLSGSNANVPDDYIDFFKRSTISPVLASTSRHPLYFHQGAPVSYGWTAAAQECENMAAQIRKPGAVVRVVRDGRALTGKIDTMSSRLDEGATVVLSDGSHVLVSWYEIGEGSLRLYVPSEVLCEGLGSDE